ncbi:MAG: hypothetical protein AUH78_07705 [Gemmatimonadetes bacterium 13_1_40CM_4_69_8]|nr:MAG: hypothetical protein AUH78_07705 [Gemmatimonadetes bacterium 13_1_40CM_4_69_8]
MAAEIVASLADAVVVTGTDRRVLTANRAAAELFGRPLDDLPGTAIDDVVASSEREHVAERERRAFQGEEQHYETKVVRANGEERVVAVSTTPLVLEGELLGAVATLRDITPQPVRVGVRCDRDARRERPLHHLQPRRRDHLGVPPRGAGGPVVRADAPR